MRSAAETRRRLRDRETYRARRVALDRAASQKRARERYRARQLAKTRPREAPAVTEPSKTAFDLTFAELSENRELLDQVLRVVCVQCDVDYLGALEKVQQWHSDAAYATTEPVTLREIITKTPQVRLSEFERDLQFLQDGESEAAAIANSDGLPDEPAGELGDDGIVRLSASDDRARLLTDAYSIEQAYLLALECGRAKSGDEGRRDFERDYRSWIEQGLDYTGTLQLDRRDAEIARQQAEARGKVKAWERQEREKRAELRRLDREAEELEEKRRQIRP